MAKYCEPKEMKTQVGIPLARADSIEYLREYYRTVTPMGERLNTGDIVLVSCHDAMYGDVVLPGVVLYAYEDLDAYEVNVLVDDGGENIPTPYIVNSWTLAREDLQLIGKAVITNKHVLP